MPRLLKQLPYAALATATLACLAISLRTTGSFNHHSKVTQFLLQMLLVFPASIWVLRQGASEHSGRSKFAKKLLPGLVLASVLVCALLAMSWYVRDGIYNADESAYLFQARIFRTLEPYADAPPAAVQSPEFTFYHHVFHDQHWFGKYPPGWPAVLAVAGAFKSEWIVNPLLGVLLLWLVYRIALKLYGQGIARTTLVLFCCSPFFLLNCVGYMSHVLCGVLIAFALLALLRGLEQRRLQWIAASFAAVAVAICVRPYTAALLGLVFAVYTLWDLRREPRLFASVLAVGIVCAAVGAGLMLSYNKLLSGSMFVSPYALYAGRDLPPELSFSSQNLYRNAVHFTPPGLAKVALHGVPFAILLAVYGLYRERTRTAVLLFAMNAILVLGYLGMSEQSDSFIGERYYFEAYFALMILAAVGWQKLRDAWRPSIYAQRAVMSAALALVVFQFVYLSKMIIVTREQYARVYQAASAIPGDSTLVLMKARDRFWAPNFNPNPANWERVSHLFVVDPGPQRRDAAACALGRKQWVVVTYDRRTRSAIFQSEPSTPNCNMSEGGVHVAGSSEDVLLKQASQNAALERGTTAQEPRTK